MQNKLFREAALQNLAVAERLDTAVQVVGPATSMVVLGAACFIVTAVVWAMVGRVPTRVYGDGLLLREGSIVDVTSMADGQVEHVAVAVGDLVKENDVLARIDQPELKKQRSLLQAKLDELSQKDTQLVLMDRQGGALKHAVFSQQRAAVTFVVAESKKQLAFYEEKLTSDEALLEKGLITPAAVAETRQRVLDMTDSIYMKQAEGRNIAFSALDSQRLLEERKYDLTMQVSETTRELEELDKRIDTQSMVLAKASGRVTELKVAEGDVVARGRAIATVEVAPTGPAEIVADIYISEQDGKQAKPGMPIKLAPSIIKPEEEGYLEGVVESVSPFPVSAQSMMRAVRNETLVNALLARGPVYAVHVRVTADPTTASGLRWSNGRGPSLQIVSGTPVHGLVTVKSRRPIDSIIPALKRLVTDTPMSAAASASE